MIRKAIRRLFEGKTIITEVVWKQGEVYKFDELPDDVQWDIAQQVSEEEGYEDTFIPLKKRSYKLSLHSHEENMSFLEEVFGYGLPEAMEEQEVVDLADNIEKFGLNHPVFGLEGLHRRLAFAYLEQPILYLELVKKDENGKS